MRIADELLCSQTLTEISPIAFQNGRVPERTNGTVSKTVRGASLSGVQIPPLPPSSPLTTSRESEPNRVAKDLQAVLHAVDV